MLRIILFTTLSILIFSSCDNPQVTKTNMSTETKEIKQDSSTYASVNGLNMYYEIHGEYIGEIATPQDTMFIHGTVSMIEKFLNESMPKQN